MTNQCDCPNSSYGKKHTPECYERKISQLRAALGSAVLMVNKLKVLGNDNVQRYDVEPWLSKVRERFPDLPNAWSTVEPTDAPSSDTDSPETQRSRILRAAAAFVGAIGTEIKAGIVSRQAPDEWLELSDAVICGRATAGQGLQPSIYQCGHPVACHSDLSCRHYGCDCQRPVQKSSADLALLSEGLEGIVRKWHGIKNNEAATLLEDLKAWMRAANLSVSRGENQRTT